ncbi:MAG: helix-turn-helix domain-containing protein [Ruminococcus sp.]|nr:helix-turn-helix domain-containing protein [Ruminococcus sp.]
MTFYERLRNICKERGTTVTNMLSKLGIATGSTGNWKRGSLPNGDILMKIADYLNTSIDYILFGEFRSDLNSDEKQLVELYRLTPDRAKYKVICDMERIVQEEIRKLSDKK